MPGTTRYSATFDRPYEEDERRSNGLEPAARARSRSLSWQANERPYTPLGGSRPPARSSSSDGGDAKGVESIPTRTVSKTVVKTHNNPFQFVKVGSSPLYRKAEEQLKKTKEVKKPDVLKEEEEEWQSNLDSWKSRRRKMSEDVFRRQEEIRKSEMEEQFTQANNNQKKIKTFSEMVESRAHRGRALSLCLISSPLDLQKWEAENGNNSNSSHPFSEGSEENSAFNSEDEGVSDKHPNDFLSASNGNGTHINKNGSSNASKLQGNRLLEMHNSSHKDGIYIDSGLESISSSHRAGDTPDSCSDFSQDSGSSIDCDSPRVSGLLLNDVNVLEDVKSKLMNTNESSDAFIKMKGTNSSNNCFNINGDITSNGELVVNEAVNGYHEKDDSSSSSLSSNGEFHASNDDINSSTPSKVERSVESENEVFVDDFDDMKASAETSSQNIQESSVKNEAFQTGPLLNDLARSAKTSSDELRNTAEPVKSYDSKLKETDEKMFKDSSEGKLASELHSKNQYIDSVQKEPKKNTVKKKKLKAKISVETCIEKSQPLLVQTVTSPLLNLGEESLNIVFQSKSSGEDTQPDSRSELRRINSKEISLNDVPPVEKVAEEMEKLILQQLEEEERAKELSSKILTTNIIGSPEQNLIAPPKVSEPPKEKPPPPPSDADIPKPTPLKRINSTKRIKKEIHKRRSNFLGIENMDDSLGFDESSVPPPLALEQILKAEMELDRESMKRLEDAAAERIKMEESEIIEKEREIIETLETEERQKNLMNNEELCEIMLEEERIEKLKEERKRMENERTVNETQRLRLEEKKLLKEREEYIRKQEVDNTSTEISTPVLSEAANTSNISPPSIASLSTETKANDLLSNTCGDGEPIANTVSMILDSTKNEVGKPEVRPKPVVPPKPLKKKEAIRKERERLRQEQEALQKEREEHRQKLLLEQEEIMKTQQKSHAPTTPVTRIGPVPPLKPTYSPQLTNPVSAPTRDKVSFPSQSFHGAQNGLADGFVEQVPVVSKQAKPLPIHKKPAQKEPWMQQKVSPVKKQSHDPMPESKYNQNHWLIQEAEMRRIAELKERQQLIHFSNSQTHLTGDEVCSNTPTLPPPVALPPQMQENMWSYGQANPMKYPKKYNPPVAAEKPVGMYPLVPPSKPSRVVPLERPEQMLSVSGRKRCSHCSDELGRGAAMIIESLQLYYHIHCFQCCVCQAQLGNGSCGTDVRVRNNKLHCHNCYSNDEAGLKFSQV